MVNGFFRYGGTIDINLLGFILLYFIIFIPYLFISKKKRNSWVDYHVVLTSLFIFYVMSVAYFVFLPIDIIGEGDRIFQSNHLVGRDYLTIMEVLNINLIPFRSIVSTIRTTPSELWLFILRGVGGNFLLLLPLPIFLCLYVTDRISIKKIFFISISTTILIEISQLAINFMTRWPNRIVDIDDVILNTMGAIVGYLIFVRYGNFFNSLLSKISDFINR